MKAAQSQYGQIGDGVLAFHDHRHGCAEGRDEHQPHQAERAVDEHDRRRQRLRLRGPGRVADADDVAADVLGRKLLKNPATRYDDSSVRAGTTMPCARSSSCQRHALVSTLKK